MKNKYTLMFLIFLLTLISLSVISANDANNTGVDEGISEESHTTSNMEKTQADIKSDSSKNNKVNDDVVDAELTADKVYEDDNTVVIEGRVKINDSSKKYDKYLCLNINEHTEYSLVDVDNGSYVMRLNAYYLNDGFNKGNLTYNDIYGEYNVTVTAGLEMNVQLSDDYSNLTLINYNLTSTDISVTKPVKNDMVDVNITIDKIYYKDDEYGDEHLYIEGQIESNYLDRLSGYFYVDRYYYTYYDDYPRYDDYSDDLIDDNGSFIIKMKSQGIGDYGLIYFGTCNDYEVKIVLDWEMSRDYKDHSKIRTFDFNVTSQSKSIKPVAYLHTEQVNHKYGEYAYNETIQFKLEPVYSGGRIKNPEKGTIYVFTDNAGEDYDYDKDETVYYVNGEKYCHYGHWISLFNQTNAVKGAFETVKANYTTYYNYTLPSDMDVGQSEKISFMFVHPDYDFYSYLEGIPPIKICEFTKVINVQNITDLDVNYNQQENTLKVRANIKAANGENIHEDADLTIKVNLKEVLRTTVKDGIIDYSIELPDFITNAESLELISENTENYEGSSKFLSLVNESTNSNINQKTTFYVENATELIESIEYLSKFTEDCNATINLMDRIDDFEGFVWNNTHVNLTIKQYTNHNEFLFRNSHLEWFYYVDGPTYTYAYETLYIYFNKPVVIGENSTLTFDSLIIGRSKPISLIENYGTLNLKNVTVNRLPVNENEGFYYYDYMEDNFISVDGRNIYNHNVLNIYDSTLSGYGKDEGNIILNENICNIFNSTLKGINSYSGYATIVSIRNSENNTPLLYIENSTLHYIKINGINDIIVNSNLYNGTYWNDGVSEELVEITSENATIQNSTIRSLICNADNLQLIGNNFTECTGSKSINLDVKNLTAVNNTICDCMFDSNNITAENIFLDSNVINNSDEFARKYLNHTNVTLKAYDVVLNNNTLINFKFNIEKMERTVDANSTPEQVDANSSQQEVTDSSENDSTVKEYSHGSHASSDNKNANEQTRTLKTFKNVPIRNVETFKDVSISNMEKAYTPVKVRKSAKITLSWLNDLFNRDFIHEHVLIYVDGVLVFNSTLSADLEEVLFNLTNIDSSEHAIKVVTDDKNIYTKIIDII